MMMPAMPIRRLFLLQSPFLIYYLDKKLMLIILSYNPITFTNAERDRSERRDTACRFLFLRVAPSLAASSIPIHHELGASSLAS